ncbi:uncharacterized protein [Penaeus vannamei]|uniref:Thrombospondin n=1 Tax=Penaeus vannamei TaxID=6689 RepID=A0A423TYJ4_PENVA|nr:uncharacterized protein LOC113802506 [Penaeus vannamei]ROT81525.1 thrombospondin [Penaeus vannamei]
MSSAALSFSVLAILVCLAASNSDDARFKCVTEGRFPHPTDCGSYIDCLPNSMQVNSCNGGAFHPIHRACVPLTQVPTCHPRKGRSVTADPKLEYACEGALSEFVCVDCKTLVNCVNGTAYPEPCADGDMCSVRESQFGGGVCYPAEPKECTCSKPNEFKVDYYDPSKFLFCQDAETDPIIYQCPEDHVFDPVMSQCRNSAGLPECSSIGVFANPENCTQYYTCIFTTSGWVQKPFSCINETDPFLMYNEASGVCEDPCQWNTGKFSCIAEGRYSDPLSCSRYFECVVDEAEETGFRQELHECPEGYVWDPSARGDFGHCVLEGASKTPCSPVTINKCTIPDNWCDNTIQ